MDWMTLTEVHVECLDWIASTGSALTGSASTGSVLTRIASTGMHQLRVPRLECLDWSVLTGVPQLIL